MPIASSVASHLFCWPIYNNANATPKYLAKCMLSWASSLYIKVWIMAPATS